MNIPEEAKLAAFYELNDVASMARVEAALTAALPHIVEGIAREAEESDTQFEAWTVRDWKPDAVGNKPGSPVNQRLADYLRSLAPMGEKA